MSDDLRRVLLVEDNVENAEMMKRRLVRRGFDVDWAMDGVECLAKASEVTPHIILMDMSLPKMDGWEATRRLKAQPATKRIPVIALTAHALASDRAKALAAGCDEYETKPVVFNRLLGKMRALLASREGGRV